MASTRAVLNGMRLASTLTLVVAIAGSGLSCGVALAQDAQATKTTLKLPDGMSDPTNAALVYSRALRLIGDSQLSAMTPDPIADPDWMNGTVATALDAQDGPLGMVREAATLPECDWGLQYSGGVAMILDHLGPMRRLVNALDAHAQLAASRSHVDAAIRDIESMLRIAEHTSRDRVLISSLVSAAMCNLAINRVNAMLDTGLIDRAQAKTVLGAIEQMSKAKDFRVLEALRTEKWMVTDSMRATYVGPQAGAKLVDAIDWMVDDGQEALKGLGLLDEAGLAKQFQGVERAYDDTMKAWQSDDATSELDRVHEAVVRGEYGLLSQAFVPSFSNSRRSVTKANDQLNALAKRLGAVK